MLRRTTFVSSRALRPRKSVDPLELFNQLQVGAVPPLNISRDFLKAHFSEEIYKRRITEARIASLDARNTASLLKDLFFDKYLAVPFRVFAFDMEFTGIPRFHSDGPTEEIVEIAVYCPIRQMSISHLVKTDKCTMSKEAEEITKISQSMINEKGVPFKQAWDEVYDFMTVPNLEQGEAGDSCENLLLLSHGGKLADVSMLEWALKKNDARLPSAVKFGDTFQLIRDLHRKRPVTPDKYPPSWNLQDMASWLKLDVPADAHRAAADAQLTWDVVNHMLDRYGNHSLTPQQQLVGRFFEKAATERVVQLGSNSSYHGGGSSGPSEDYSDFDDLF